MTLRKKFLFKDRQYLEVFLFTNWLGFSIRERMGKAHPNYEFCIYDISLGYFDFSLKIKRRPKLIIKLGTYGEKANRSWGYLIESNDKKFQATYYPLVFGRFVVTCKVYS